ncbi:CLIP-associating protein 1-A [Trichinella zimbabwensis]|uniref:CLIP-associating protein 1-A n=1 Tax=Trichinella zimbabwensis TaxID=268475 RepID=A0A0V1I7R1_9BILA|nr:CLIP-associating protein 1-A [Trichinella zimbabwensis]
MGNFSELLNKNSTDPKTRVELGQQLLDLIQREGVPNDANNLTLFMDVMVQWLNGTNFKVALLALEILSLSLEVSGATISHIVLDNASTIMERLGDNREQVRQDAVGLLLKLMNTPGCTPQGVLDRVVEGLSHKQWLVRIGVMIVLQQILRSYGPSCLQLGRLVPSICRLLADPMNQVRDVATETLVEMYVFLGDKLAMDIQRKQLVPNARAAALFSRFEDVKRNGLVGNSCSNGTVGSALESVTDFTDATPTAHRQISSVSTTLKKPLLTAVKQSEVSNFTGKRATSAPPVKRLQTTSRYAGNAGAVDEESFYAAFEDVPKVEIFSAKELSIQLQQIRTIVMNTNGDWEKRIDSLKRLRSLLISGASQYDEFFVELRSLEVPMQIAGKDLRSQVVREVCITVAYLAERLGPKFDHFAEIILPLLISLIQNSAKVVSTSGLISCRFIIKNTHAPRIVPVITGSLESKSKEIRRCCCDFIAMMCQQWSSHELEKNVGALQGAIRRGLSDADPEARAFSRKAYWSFSDHFRDQAEMLFQSLDPGKQRQLLGEVSQSSSSHSLYNDLRTSQESVKCSTASQYGASRAGGTIPCLRSASEIDTGAVRRAVAMKQANAGKAFLGVASSSNMNSLPRPMKMLLSTSGNYPKLESSTPRSPTSTSNKSVSQRRKLDDVGSESPPCFFGERSFRGSESSENSNSMMDVLRSCSSTVWIERKEGLLCLQSFFRSGGRLAAGELKKACDLFARLFVDPHHKMFTVFLDTVIEFLQAHGSDIQDWLFVLLCRLLSKQSNELLPSVQSKLLKTMDVVRAVFPIEAQFQALTRYLVDPTQTPNVKMKLNVLNYLNALIYSMQSCHMTDTADMRMAISRIVQWTGEPKSTEVRRTAQATLLALFSLNTPMFSQILSSFSKAYQDTVSRILNTHIRHFPDLSTLCIHDSAEQSSKVIERNSDVQDSLRRTSEEIMRYPFSSDCKTTGSNGSTVLDTKNGSSGQGARLGLLSNGVSTDEERQEEIIGEILTELSNHNASTRQPQRFQDYAELTILKLLDAHKDPERKVTRAAEDCAAVLALHLAPLVCLRVLTPVIVNDQGPALLAAIKMTTKVIEQMDTDELLRILKELPTWAGRKCFIFLVDCDSAMFTEAAACTAFQESITAIRDIYCHNSVTGERDYLATVLYNTKKAENSHRFNGISVLHNLSLPSVEKVKQLESLCNGPPFNYFNENYGTGQSNIDEVFWLSAMIKVQNQRRTIFLFTNNDSPHQGDAELRKRGRKKIKDLKEKNVTVEVIAVGTTKFVLDNFYKVALADEHACQDDNLTLANRADDLFSRIVKKTRTRRGFATLNFSLGPGIDISVTLYNNISTANLPQSVMLDGRTNGEVKLISNLFDPETGEKLHRFNLVKYQEYGRRRIAMTEKELEQMSSFTSPVLLGFQPLNRLKVYHHLRPAFFISPNENIIKGSTVLLNALMRKCSEKEMTMICRLTARKNTSPRLVALVAQIESEEAVQSAKCRRFHGIYLPYEDDLRDLQAVIASAPKIQVDNHQLVDLWKKVIKRMQIQYTVGSIQNPVLQKHYRTLEAVVLDREKIGHFVDQTMNLKWIDNEVGMLLQQIKEHLNFADQKESSSNCTDAEFDLEAEARNGLLGKRTVVQLRNALRSKGVVIASNTRKPEIIKRILDLYAL